MKGEQGSKSGYPERWNLNEKLLKEDVHELSWRLENPDFWRHKLSSSWSVQSVPSQ